MWSTTAYAGDKIQIGDTEILILEVDRGKTRIGVKTDPNVKIVKIHADGPNEKDGNTESVRGS